MDYIKHNEAGRTAARYIMHRWPDLFKLKELDTVSLYSIFYSKTLSLSLIEARCREDETIGKYTILEFNFSYLVILYRMC